MNPRWMFTSILKQAPSPTPKENAPLFGKCLPHHKVNSWLQAWTDKLNDNFIPQYLSFKMLTLLLNHYLQIKVNSTMSKI